MIECGAQATGGNYSFFNELSGMGYVGFPIAEIEADGSSVITKHEGTGGGVTVGTVTSQLLYEIGPPAYANPDVISRFDTIELDEIGTDRVRISGTRGEPAPPNLKVAMNSIGGYRNSVSIGLTGLDIEAKAALVEEAFWRSCPYAPSDFAQVSSHVVRTDKENPGSNEEAVASWRVTVKDPDERKVGRAFTNAGTEIALAAIPGFFGLSGGPRGGGSYGVYRPALIPSDLVPQEVVVGGQRTAVENTPTSILDAPVAAVVPSLPSLPTGETLQAPLGAIAGARSGDKGGNANLGLFTRSPEAYVWLADFLTVRRFKALMTEAASLEVDRFDLPNIWSLNFVIHGLLEEGVAAVFDGSPDRFLAFAAVELGVRQQPGQLAIVRNLMHTKWLLWRRSRASILEAPEMSDQEMQVCLRILLAVFPPAYQCGDNDLFAVAALKATTMSIRG